jgi:hypothetical protein
VPSGGVTLTWNNIELVLNVTDIFIDTVDRCRPRFLFFLLQIYAAPLHILYDIDRNKKENKPKRQYQHFR